MLVLAGAFGAAVAGLGACGSSSSATGTGGAQDCPKLPHRDLAQNPDGTVLCREPIGGSDATMLICRNGAWQTVLNCADSTQTTEGGFVHPCKCADSATGDVAYCTYIGECSGTRVSRGGAAPGSGGSGGTGGAAGSGAGGTPGSAGAGTAGTGAGAGGASVAESSCLCGGGPPVICHAPSTCCCPAAPHCSSGGSCDQAGPAECVCNGPTGVVCTPPSVCSCTGSTASCK